MNAMPDLDRIRYVTTHYRDLQGLRLLPYGAALLVWALGLGVWPSVPWVSPLALWLALGLFWLISRYYTRTFGRVQPVQAISRAGLAVLALLLVAMLALPLAARAHVHMPLGLLLGGGSLLCAAAGVSGLWRAGGLRLRAHWIILALLLAATSVLVMLPLFRHRNTLLAVSLGAWGLAAIIGGVLDHRLLRRTLPPAQEEHPEEQHAEAL
jgi:hypothetical protein